MRPGKPVIDINCDMGEGIGNDALLMPFISSANIACGYHAGDEKSIWETMELALSHHVATGAHVSFLDKEHFGRNEMILPEGEIYELVTQQLILAVEIANSLDTKIHHVKPHGALYNMSARDRNIAKAIASAVKDFNPELILVGLSGSNSITEGEAIGLKTASEVFADRTYQDDGSLTPRSQPNSLIDDVNIAVERVGQMVLNGTVSSVSGKTLRLRADTICIHGDGANATQFAKAIHERMKQLNIEIKAC